LYEPASASSPVTEGMVTRVSVGR
ncbi:MAG: hypothetical protein QOI83_2102, partial [Streptomycetaceae bacterium]|nr:hypothetical protein [Streptomycetaceae bacterium]